MKASAGRGGCHSQLFDVVVSGLEVVGFRLVVLLVVVLVVVEVQYGGLLEGLVIGRFVVV